MKIDVRHRKIEWILLTGWGAFFLILLILKNKMDLRIFIASLGGIIAGITHLIGPYFTVEDEKIILHARLGPLKKEYPFNSLKDIIIRKNKLYLIQNGEEKLIAFGANKKDMEYLDSKIKEQIKN